MRNLSDLASLLPWSKEQGKEDHQKLQKADKDRLKRILNLSHDQLEYLAREGVGSSQL